MSLSLTLALSWLPSYLFVLLSSLLLYVVIGCGSRMIKMFNRSVRSCVVGAFSAAFIAFCFYKYALPNKSVLSLFHMRRRARCRYRRLRCLILLLFFFPFLLLPFWITSPFILSDAFMFFYLTRWSRRNSLYAYALRTFADDKPLLPLILLFILSLIVLDVDDDDENS